MRNMKNTIREDLRNGLSIAETCTKYHMSFKDLCNLMKSDNYFGSKCPTTGERYISHIGDRYILRKNNTYYGQYKTMQDAKKVRNYLARNGWNVTRRQLLKICEELGVEL